MDKARAQQVLARIDAILRWEQKTDQHKDQKFAELGKHLCEVRKQGYWRLGHKSFEAYLEEKFPDSRPKAYYRSWPSEDRCFERDAGRGGPGCGMI